MQKTTTRLALGASIAMIAAVAAPAAGGKPDAPHGQEHGQGGSQSKRVGYVFKGTYVDSATVDVSAGNHHVKKAGLVGGPVSFDFSGARVVVADGNQDGVSDLLDVLAGDRVLVKVRAPKPDPGLQPFAARRLIDQTRPADYEESSAP